MSVLEDVAAWVAGLSYEDIPERVLALARNQVLSVMGAIHAGAGSAGGEAVAGAVEGWGGDGPCAAFPGGHQRPFYSAILQNCSLSMSLDYDDYLFMGHTGHSAVLVPFAVAQMRGATSRDSIVAQVAANEVAGRLGASVLLGPHNGQMWAHIHLMGAAAAASYVIGLDAGKTADAMGIALAEPVYPLFPGFMGPGSKLLTAAVPALTGTMAAFLAENGMTGSHGIIEDPQGFWEHFCFLPLPFMFTGLGSAWVTDTIAFKPYPGCAYIDTAVDALLEIMEGFENEKGRPIDHDEVQAIDVEASLLTIAMDAMSGGYLEGSGLSPTVINFSIPVSLSMVLLAGELSGAQFSEEYLSANRDRILKLAGRISLKHDASLTVRFIKSLDDVLDLKSFLAQLELRGLMGARRRLREHVSRVGKMGASEALAAWRSLSPEDRSYLRSLFTLRNFLGASPGYDLGEKRLDELAMPFGARVTVRLKDGTVLEAQRLVPRGAPGDPARLRV
ncbi:MAG: MmgE/PrpD family protein, partial [Actinobacteria bacterium]|nr:MmgE/PrpD family protein [Actinomycetota bacterium]